jgi:hypothetical protein
MADSRVVALYAEQDKITQALRCFSEPRAADYPATFKAEDIEHADRLRHRLRAIETELDNLETQEVSNIATTARSVRGRGMQNSEPLSSPARDMILPP